VTSFVLLATISLLINAAGAADAAKQNTIAYNAARQVVENVRNYRGAPLAPGEYTDVRAFGAVPQLDATATSGMKDARATMSIRMYRNPVKLVTVEVRWRSGERGGVQRSRTLSTLISPNGVAM